MTHWSECPETLPEIFEHSERYGDGKDFWTNYLAKVASMDPHQRAGELAAFDRKMPADIRPSRENAELISKRRELGALHDLLRNAGQ